MTELIFSGAGSTIYVSGKIVYGTDFYEERINQSSLNTADGGTVVYDVGPFCVYTTLVLKGVTKGHATQLRYFITNTLLFQKYLFNINISQGVPESLNLGAGFGYAVTDARLTFKSMKGVFELVAPGTYNVTLPFKIIKDTI